MVAAATSTDALALLELNALEDGMRVSLVEAKNATALLDALKRAEEARAKRKRDLEAAIEEARREVKARGLAGLLTPMRRRGLDVSTTPTRARRYQGREGLGDLAGGGGASWTRGQYQKVQAWANQRAWSTMLEAAMRLAFPGGKDPRAVLADPADFARVAEVLNDANQGVPLLQAEAQAALEEMRASVLGQPSRAPFDQAEYDAAAAGDMSYIQTHKKQGDLAHALRETGRVVGSLDKYVPGWSVLLDVATPVLPVAPLISNLVSALPLVGGAARAATQAAPLLGKGGLAPLSPTSPLSFGASSPVASGLGPAVLGVQAVPAASSDLLAQGVQTVAGPAGAVRFQLTKSTAQAASRGLGVLETLEKLGTDLVDGYVLAASLAAMFVTGPELLALQGALSALQAGITLKKTTEAAAAMRKAAAAARAAAQVKAAQEDAELSALERTLADLRAKLAAVVKAAKKTVPAGTGSGLARLAAALAVGWFLSEVLS